MALLEFRCAECGEEYEVLTNLSGSRFACPKCGSERVNRKLSAFAAVTDGLPEATPTGAT
jgi:putative FmdB family regulatory protein